MDLTRARYWGLGVLVWLNILDLLTTYVALQHGATEGNPITRHVIDHGFGWVITLKAIVLVLLAIGITRVRRDWAALAVWTAVGAYLMVITINVSTLRTLAAR